MIYKFISENLKYDGSQLKSLFAYMNYQIMGDSIVAFTGPCDIPFAHMVDGEDVLAGAAIRGDSMLHFIIEEFGKNLELAATRQRLFAALVLETLTKMKPDKVFTRDGDDIFVDGGKLSISIATVSPVSSLIHFAMNITNEGTPVKTSCLKDLGIAAEEISGQIASALMRELEGIEQAQMKVRWVQ